MDTNIGAIRDALAEACQYEGFNVYDEMPEVANIVLPAVIVPWPDAIEYNTDYQGSCNLYFNLLVVVQTAHLGQAQTQIDQALSFPDGLPYQIQTYSPATPVWRGIKVTEAAGLQLDRFPDTNERFLIGLLQTEINT